MTESKEIRLFFSKLSFRLKKENNLSDVTWALCECCPEFKRAFLNFFFPEIDDIAGIELQREYMRAESRPDFYFLRPGFSKEYIIEFKRYDTNDHFDQYKSDFNSPRFGWIAIYQRFNVPDVEIRTWEQFHKVVESLGTRDDLPQNSKSLVQGYCSYIQSVCSIIQFHKMKLDNLSSLFLFNKLVERIIFKPSDRGVDTAVYTQARDTSEKWSGKNFTLSKAGSTENVMYPWFGIYYDQEITCICMGFSYSACRAIYNEVERNPKEGKYHILTYYDEGHYWFELRKEYFKKFNELGTAEEQETLLTAFYEEVIDAVKVK